MTLEEVNSKINGFNRRLDDFITDLQSTNTFDESKLRTMSGAIERVILNDPIVRKILLDENAANRQEYINAIKSGIEETNRLLKSYKQVETGTKKDKISDISDKANKGFKQTIEGIEKVDNDDVGYVYTDSERVRDLNEKIAKINSSLVIADKFDEIKNALSTAGRPDTTDEAIKVCKELENDFKNYEDKKDNIENLETMNFSKMFEKYKDMRGNVTYDLNDEETQRLLIEMRKSAKLLDYVDSLDLRDHANFVRTVENMPSDLKNQSQVDAWMSTLQTKFDDPNMSKKLDTTATEYKEFIKARKDFVKSQFITKLENSPVHTNLDKDNIENIKVLSDSLLKKYVQETTKNLISYKAIEGKSKSDLLRYKNEAEKLLESYDLAVSSTGTATVNGKTKVFTTDMTDESKSQDALEEIRALASDDEFKTEFENKALALAGTRPQNRWYHKVLKFITFNRYMTPEDKYEINLESKRREVVTDIMKENKEKRESAQNDIKHDKNAYKSVAREEIVKSKGKKIDKKKIVAKRESKETLTR